MAKDGVIDIGLRVDYDKTLQDMVKDFDSAITKISNEFKKNRNVADLRNEFNDLKKTILETFGETSKVVNTKDFEIYQQKATDSLQKIAGEIVTLNERIDAIDGSASVEALTKKFDKLRVHISQNYKALKEIVSLNDINNTGANIIPPVDKTAIDDYKELLKLVEEYEKKEQKAFDNPNYGNAVKQNKKSDKWDSTQIQKWTEDVKTALSAFEESTGKCEEIQASMSALKPDTEGYVELENKLIRIQIAAQEANLKLKDLETSGRKNGVQSDLYPKIRDVGKRAYDYYPDFEAFEDKANAAIAEANNTRNAVEQAYEEVSTFQIKNGKLRVPIELSSDSQLKSELEQKIESIRKYAQDTPIKVGLDTKHIQNEAEKLLKSISDVVEKHKIQLHINEEEIINEVKTSVKTAIEEVSKENFGLDIGKSLDSLIEPLQKVIDLLSGNEGFKLGLDEASINRITSSIENMANMIKRAFGVASDNDIANQWSVIEDKFKSAAGEEGKLLAKNKEHKVAMQELAAEYKKYLDMGGEKTFSDLSSHRYTVQNLTKAYEDLGKSVQETTQKQEKQKTTQKTSKADSEAIRSTTRANKSLETQADKTSTSIKNEANSAQSASEKFRKLAKEKGNATIANRELAKAAKETADALGREVKARKEAENSRGSKNAVDSGVYNANALDWQRKIKQELLDSDNYAEVYNAKISQTAKGNVSFASSVQTMDGEWKSFTATLDNSGNIVSSKLKDLTEKQVSAIERAKEQARQMMEALAQAMNGEETKAVSYDRDTMEQLIADAVKATQAMEGLDAKYKTTLNNSGGITIIKTLTEANGVVKTFTAEFDDVKTVINAANSSVEEFSTLMNEAFDRAKVSISTKSAKVDTSDTETVISHYEEMYEVIKKINDLDVKILGLDDKKNVNQLSLLRNEFKETTAEYLRLMDILNQKGGIDSFSSEELGKLLDLYEEASEKIEKIKAKLADGFVTKGYSALDNFKSKYSSYNGYDEYEEGIKRITEEIKTLSSQEGLDSVKKKLQDIGQELSNIKTNNANEIRLGTIIEGKTFSDINELRSNIVSLMSNIGEVNEKSIKIKGAKSLSAEVKKTNGEIHNMTVNLDNNGFAHYVDNGIAEFKRLGSAAGSVFKGIKDLVRIYLSPQDFIRYFRQGFDAVTEVDTALTELIKVSDASDNAIAEYFDGAVESAKELGSSVIDMISTTADWARLGYNFPDSKKLGEVAVLYKNVGDGIDIDAANESIVSTLQGFQLEADDAISIVDKFNEVSNNFAISSGGLGEALKRSAAAFNAANTDLSGAIALITTGNEVVQSPEKVGTMWQTVSARIRGTKLEAEELGLETDGMVESTSKLRDIIKSTTKFDILEADGKTYKDMYEIILGIGKEWKNLNDTTRAGLLETLAGKKQSNTLAAVLNNIERLEDVYQTAEQSSGSAQKEQDKYAKSLQYSLDQLKAHGEEFWTTFINKDDVKDFINLINSLISAATKLVDTFGSIPSIAGVLGGVATLKKNVGGAKLY